MKKVVVLGTGNIGALTARGLAATLARPDVEAVCTHNPERGWDAVHQAELDFLLANTAPEVLASPDCVLVCDSAEQLAAFRPLLDAAGLAHVGMRVAAPLPTFKERLAAAVRLKETRVQHLTGTSQPAGSHTPPTTKARKAARRRAKAGRKASR